MSARNVFYAEVVVNGNTTDKIGPTASLTDKQAISHCVSTARSVLKMLDPSQHQNVKLHLSKGNVYGSATYTIEADKYPSRRKVDIQVHDNLFE